LANNAVGPAEQGNSVALSADGNTAIVGGPLDSSDTGAAWVFTRSGTVWTQQQKLVGTGAVGNARQGTSVALSSDGSTAILGGPFDNSSTGAAWVFTRSGSVWTQQQKLAANNAVGSAHEGNSVALSADGSTAIVGGPGDSSNAGAAWVFTRSGSVWTQQQKLVEDFPAEGNLHGNSVALSSDGNTAIVGAPGVACSICSPPAAGLGGTWVYNRSNGVWTQLNNGNFVDTNVPNTMQGLSVAVTSNGITWLTGAPGVNSAFVQVVGNPFGFQSISGTPAVGNARQGTSVALSSDGSTAILGGPFDNSSTGAAWVFGPPPFTAFSAFSVHLTVYPNQKEFSINSNFTLGTTSNGINPPTEPVTLKIGSLTITIPAGSFVNAGSPGYFTFVGVIDGVSLNVLIRQTSGNNYIFGVIAKNVSLTIQNPVSVTLTIGDDSGTTSVNAVIINTG
jgi:hypothetical protein